MAGNVHGQFQATPDPKLVKRAAQMVLNDLLAGTNNSSNLAVGQTLPNQDGNLNLFRGEALTRSHDRASSLLNIAMASFTRFRPSRMPARRNNVLKCCLTVG